MQHKISFITTLLITSIINLSAQTCDTATYAHGYWFRQAPNAQPVKIIEANDGYTYIFGHINIDPNTNIGRDGVYITKLNKRGTPLFTNMVSGQKDAYLTDVAVIPGGGFYISGRSKNYGFKDGEPWAGRLDKDGKILWNVGLGVQEGQFDRIITATDGGCVAVGRLARVYKTGEYNNIYDEQGHCIIVKLDKNGKLQWGREFYTQEEQDGVGDVIQLPDGNLVISGAKDGNTQREYFLMKVDVKDGHTIWQEQTTDALLWHSSLRSDGMLVYHENDFIFVLNPADGTVTQATKLTVPPGSIYTYYLRYGGSFNDTEYFYYDYVDRSYILFLKIANNNKVAWGSRLPLTLKQGNIIDVVSGAIQKATGNLSVTGTLESNALSTAGPGEKNTYVLSTNMDGKSVCSDTFSNKFIFSPAPIPAMLGFGWAHESKFTAMDAVYLGDSAKFHLNGIDCYSTQCCWDTTVNTTVNMCEGGSYTLPDGRVLTKPGAFSFIYKRASGCDSIVFITVGLVKPTRPDLGNDTCFLGKNEIIFNPHASYVENYTWQDGSQTPTYTAKAPGEYWVQVKNACGLFRDTAVIYSGCSFPLYIPNAFTPNGDGVNDVFRIHNLNSQKLVGFSIYNRWGQLVFKTTDPAKGWDGTINGMPVQIATTFVYQVYYKDLSGKLKFVKGTINLLK